MKHVLILAMMVGFILSLPEPTLGGPGQQPGVRSGVGSRGSVSRGRVRHGVPVYRFAYPGYSYYSPYYQPPVVISPYGPSYYLPPVAEVTSPYFCVLHNAGFVTRAGMLDHLAGTHKFALESAARLCPDGVDSCIYPMP